MERMYGVLQPTTRLQEIYYTDHEPPSPFTRSWILATILSTQDPRYYDAKQSSRTTSVNYPTSRLWSLRCGQAHLAYVSPDLTISSTVIGGDYLAFT